MCNKKSKRWIPRYCEIASSIKCMINSPDGIWALAWFRYRILHLFLHSGNILAESIERQNFGSRTRRILSDGPLLHVRVHEQCQPWKNGRLPKYLMELFFGSVVLLLWSNRDTRSFKSSLSDIWCINDASELLMVRYVSTSIMSPASALEASTPLWIDRYTGDQDLRPKNNVSHELERYMAVRLSSMRTQWSDSSLSPVSSWLVARLATSNTGQTTQQVLSSW